MFGRKNHNAAPSAPSPDSLPFDDGWGAAGSVGQLDPWSSTPSSMDRADQWSNTPEQRTGVALLGQENMGGAATSRVMDSANGFMSRDTWGPDGRVVKGVKGAQTAVDMTSKFMNSGAGKLVQDLPGIGRYARTIKKGAELGKTISDGLDSIGGINGVVNGVDGILRDPRMALNIVKQDGAHVAAEGFRAAAGSLAEQVGVGEMTPEGILKAKLNLGRMASVGAEIAVTGGTSVFAMLTEAGAAGADAAIRSGKDKAYNIADQFGGIPTRAPESNNDWDNWGAPTGGWNSEPVLVGAGWGNSQTIAADQPNGNW